MKDTHSLPSSDELLESIEPDTGDLTLKMSYDTNFRYL